MYLEIFLILLLLVVVYFIFFYDERIDYLASDGNRYKIIDSNNEQLNKTKADMLARLNKKAKQVVNNMYTNQLPTKQIGDITHRRFMHCIIGEIKESEGGGLTVGKGVKMGVCLVTKGKLNDENDAFFVILHELAHVMSNSYGHGDEFKQNFDFIVKLAVKLELWKPKNYHIEPVDYCGVTVTNSPCTGLNGQVCDKDNLDYYYKESLMAYK